MTQGLITSPSSCCYKTFLVIWKLATLFISFLQIFKIASIDIENMYKNQIFKIASIDIEYMYKNQLEE